MAKKREVAEKATRSLDELISEAQKIDKKKKTAEEKAQEELQAMLEYSSLTPQEEDKKPVYETNYIHDPNKEWDVRIGDKIEYFDPTLSYELTGYRPITKDEGLDFNPKLFTVAADNYRRNEKYTTLIPGTIRHKQYWDEEWNRCINGLTIGKYRLTGQNYFFLNYYRLSSVISDDKSAPRVDDFPGFLSKQYEYFHYMELVRVLKKDGLAFKARRVGASEIAASNVAHAYTFYKKSMSIITAFIEDFAKATLEKVWAQLHFLNTQTDGAFRHVRMKIDTDMHKRASKVDRDKNESGWMSEIKGITHDKPRKLRGYAAENLYFEECFSPDTLVIMSDYSRKRIEDIKVGDFVMGIDGTPQEVVKTNSGYDDLYLVKQRKGEDYITTGNHKLYVESRPRVWNYKDEIKLITPVEYLALNAYNKRTTYGLKSSGLNFNTIINDLDPYFLGAWLGDGNSSAISIIINESYDQDIKDYVLKYFNSQLDNKHHISIKLDSKCKLGTTNCLLNHYQFSGNVDGPNQNKILNIYKKYNLIKNKHIPTEVFYAPIDFRLKVLAGLIDTDGNLKKGSSSYSFSYEISMAREQLIKEIAELARSCGFDIHLDYRKPKSGYKKESNIYRVVIRGDLKRIPVLVTRKKLPQDYIQTTNPLSTSILIEKLSRGKYCGITLRSYGKNSDNLFLLNDYTIVHNCGSDPMLIKTYVQSEPLVNPGGVRIGSRWVWGTSGDETIALAGLKEMFYNPESYGVLPFKNRNTESQEPEFTGYFIPSYTMWYGDGKTKGFDSRGVVDEERAKKYFTEEVFGVINDPHLLLLKKAEFCFTPEDAFVLEGSNRFDKDLLVEQLQAITLHKTVEKPKCAKLHWGHKDDGTTDRESKPEIEFVSDSPLKIVELPIKDPNEIPYNNLYIAGIDSIDSDKTTSTGQTDVSQFCMVVMRKQFGLQPPKVVAIYKERPNHIQIAFDNAIKLCQFYNCKALFEATRVSIKSHFEHYHMLNYLMHRPSATSNTTTRTNLKQYGAPATDNIIDHQLDLIEQYIVDYSDQIQFPEMLDELIRYSYENKRKFDIVAAFGMVMLADEETRGRIAKPQGTGGVKFTLAYVKNKYGQIELKRIEQNESTSYDEYRRTQATDTGSYRMHILTPVNQPTRVRSLYSR